MKIFLVMLLSTLSSLLYAQTDTTKIKLKEVVITGRQPIIQQQTDRSVIIINDQVKALASTTLDLLRLAPGITVSDNEDALQMSGKDAVEIMINDRLVKMSIRDLLKYLKSLPLATISQLEVMTNPSSKYDISGNTGLLNIRIKRSENRGITGNMDLSHTQARHSMGDLSTLLNYGAERFAANAYLAYHYGNYLTQSTQERVVNDRLLYQSKNSSDRWRDPAFRVNAEYYIDRRQTLAGLLSYERSKNISLYQTDTFISNSLQSETSIQTSSMNPNTSNWKTYNLNYRFADTLGIELTFDLDRSVYVKDEDTQLFTIGELSNVDRYQTLTRISINTFKGDYTTNLPGRLKLEAGFKGSAVRTDNNLKVESAVNSLPGVQRKDNFLYREYVNGVYLNLSKRYAKWNWQTGFRLEHSRIKGVAGSETAADIQKPDSAYWNLMPAMYLSYKPSAKHNFRLAFNQRIKRPSYTVLRPFTYQIDAFTVETGNPELRVQKNTSAELTYTFKDRITLSCAYVHTDDYFTPVLLMRGDVLVETTANAGKMDNWNFLLNYPVKVAKWWTMVNKLNGFHNHFNGQLFQGLLYDGKWSYNASTSQRLSFSKSYIVTLSGRYASAMQNLIYTQRSTGNVSLSLSKKLFKEQGNFRIGLSDFFKTQRTFTDVRFGDLIYAERATWESRRVSIGFSWQFGNKKIRQTRDRNTGSADEKSRSGE